MAHFAEIDNNGIVLSVVVINNNDLLVDGVESEEAGIDLCNKLIRPARWVQTSANMRNGVHINPDTLEPSGKPNFRFNFAHVGGLYIDSMQKFTSPQPAPWAYLNAQYDWECPRHINPVTGENLSTDIQLLRRYSSLYRVEPVVLKNPDYPTAEVCLSNDFMIKQIEDITHGHNISMDIFKNADGDFDFSWVRAETVLDLTPICTINSYEILDFTPSQSQVIKHFHRIHPQSVGITLHELFRLIIEWAWAFRELGNSEPMAELSDKILCAVQMPLDVRKELLALPYQAVGRFLSGEESYAEAVADEPVAPPLFTSWSINLMRKFPARGVGDPIVEVWGNDYPV